MQGHIVPHLKARRYGKYDLRGLSYGSTVNIYQDVLKSGNLLHKRGFVDSQLSSTVDRGKSEISLSFFSYIYPPFVNIYSVRQEI